MERYTLVFGKTQGLAKVICNTPNSATSAYGEDVTNEFRKIESALIKKYGKPTSSYDFLRQGSIWKEQRYWTMGLLKGERNLLSVWSTKKGVKLPENLQGILVKAVAVDTEKFYIMVSYEFNNFNEVMEEIQAKKAQGL